VFNQLGDLERCALRSGNVYSADGWRAVLEPVIARYRGTVKRRYFRGDAAFANPEIYEFLEAEAYGYAIRLPTNRVVQDKIGYLLTASASPFRLLLLSFSSQREAATISPSLDYA
jgi:DDE family transposase